MCVAVKTMAKTDAGTTLVVVIVAVVVVLVVVVMFTFTAFLHPQCRMVVARCNITPFPLDLSPLTSHHIQYVEITKHLCIVEIPSRPTMYHRTHTIST
jgi:hypothetical protein